MPKGAQPGALPPNARPDWSSLMARSQNGDRDAYRLLLREIAGCLRLLIVRQRLDPLDVEDIVQDILVTVHALRHTFDPGRHSFLGWRRSRIGGSATRFDGFRRKLPSSSSATQLPLVRSSKRRFSPAPAIGRRMRLRRSRNGRHTAGSSLRRRAGGAHDLVI
jgi:sigma-70-like protein